MNNIVIETQLHDVISETISILFGSLVSCVVVFKICDSVFKKHVKWVKFTPNTRILSQNICSPRETLKNLLFPLHSNATNLVKRHVWCNKQYVGATPNGPIVWKGWSAKLSCIFSDYRTIYANFVRNELSLHDRRSIFGLDFSNYIATMEHFVVLYTIGFEASHEKLITKVGFLPRKVGKKLHATRVVHPDKFVQGTSKHWAADLVCLANFSLQIRIPTSEIRNENIFDNDEKPSFLQDQSDDLNLII